MPACCEPRVGPWPSVSRRESARRSDNSAGGDFAIRGGSSGHARHHAAPVASPPRLVPEPELAGIRARRRSRGEARSGVMVFVGRSGIELTPVPRFAHHGRCAPARAARAGSFRKRTGPPIVALIAKCQRPVRASEGRRRGLSKAPAPRRARQNAIRSRGKPGPSQPARRIAPF